MTKLDENIGKFIHSEGKFHEPSMNSYIQSLKEQLENMEAKTMREARRIEIAKENLMGIRRHSKRLQEQIGLLESTKKELEEKLTMLEEDIRTLKETTEPK